MMRKLLCMMALAGSFLLLPAPPIEAAQAVVVKPHYQNHGYMRHHHHRYHPYGPNYRPYYYRGR